MSALEKNKYIICKECGNKFKELNSHLRHKHKMTCDEYKSKWNVKYTKCEDVIDRFRGENNPWSNHNGKYSPFSKNGINYSQDAIEKAIKNRSYQCRLDYWINKGYDEDEAKKKLSDRQQTFTLEKCIKRHGEEKGYKIWKERQEKWQNTLESKSIEEKREINKKKASRINYQSLWTKKLDDPGILYLIKWEDSNTLKIGITSRTIKERFNRTDRKYNEILILENHSISKCFEIEQYILRKFKQYHVYDKDSYECFTYDIKKKIIKEIEKIKELDYEEIKQLVRNMINEKSI